MKKSLIAAVLLLLGCAWYSAVSNYIEKPKEYHALIKKAEAMEAKEVYYDAILNYKAALEYKPGNAELYYKIAEDYRKLGEDDNYEQVMDEVINLEAENETAVFELADYYLEDGRKEDAIALLKEQKNKTGSEAINTKLQSLAGGYTSFSQQYEYISNPCSGCMKVQMDEQWGLADSSGKTVIWPQYENIGLFGSNGFAPVKAGNASYFIDQNNYKRRVPDETYEELGIANQGLIPAKKNGKWGYLDFDLHPLTEFVYDEATPVLNSLAAVSQNGKWALLNENLDLVAGFEFDDVIRDEWGFCSRNGVVFAKRKDAYLLLDNEANQLGDNTFENASAFVSANPAAVMNGEKWGYVTTEGELVLEYRYQGAGSFSEIGYAPAETDDGWGYIKENGDFVIKPEFEGAKSFSESGIAPVMNNGSWNFIQLDIF